MTSLISGVVQHYEWGDRHTLPELLGLPTDDKPWAELWFGTHLAGPSKVRIQGESRALADVAGDLSFLVKVIAAAEPLSLQTHPTLEQARAGFERENNAGVPVLTANRIYRDASAKPELLCALTNFDALCGFRPLDESIRLCTENGWDELGEHLVADGLDKCVEWALRTKGLELPHNLPDWVPRMATAYPESGGILVALLMNYVQLVPDESLFLDAGNVHAYLHGTAVEVMSSSDNVIRAAFTKKYVDINEFVKVANLSPSPPSFCRPTTIDLSCVQYEVPTSAFGMQRIDVRESYSVTANHDAEILLCTSGDAGIVSRGQAAVLSSGEEVRLTGPATVFRTWGTK